MIEIESQACCGISPVSTVNERGRLHKLCLTETGASPGNSQIKVEVDLEEEQVGNKKSQAV